MTQQIDGTIYIIDSSTRQNITNETGSNFTYQLLFPRDKNYDSVCVLQAIIPKSYYLVAVPYNQMVLREPGAADTTITLVPGNYNALSFQTIIGALLTSNSPHGWTYTIAFPNSLTQVDTGKFTYTVSGNGGVQPSFIFGSNELNTLPTTGAPQNTVYEQFGFDPNSTNTFVANNLISQNVVKFQVEDVLFIHSDISYNNDQSMNSDVLLEIYSSSTPNYSNIIWQNSMPIESFTRRLRAKDNQVFHFNLTDEHGFGINLNGLNMVFTILVYKKDNINEIQRRYINTQLLRYQNATDF